MSSTAPPVLQIPPLRTDLQEPQESTSANAPPDQTAANGGVPQHRTAKEWYYYWAKTGRQVNQNTQKLAGLVTYGQHWQRPSPTTVPDGALYVESDRGYVIYQNDFGVWHYCAGTMWGTMSPDQRPTDLGVDDAGFQYRSTDTPARFFIWSGSAWVDVTNQAVIYGPHASRPASSATPDGEIYIESDRGYVIYVNAFSAWHYSAGTMWGTMSPDQRPTDLGVDDAGFQYRSTDSPPQFWMWSGSAWVNSTGVSNNSAEIVYGSANPTLTTTATDVPGCQLVLSKAGTWLLLGVAYMYCEGTGDNNQFLQAQLNVNGAIPGAGISTALPAGGAATVGQQWIYVASGGEIAKLQAFKSGGTGTSQLFGMNSSLSAIWISP